MFLFRWTRSAVPEVKPFGGGRGLSTLIDSGSLDLSEVAVCFHLFGLLKVSTTTLKLPAVESSLRFFSFAAQSIFAVPGVFRLWVRAGKLLFRRAWPFRWPQKLFGFRGGSACPGFRVSSKSSRVLSTAFIMATAVHFARSGSHSRRRACTVYTNRWYQSQGVCPQYAPL